MPTKEKGVPTREESGKEEEAEDEEEDFEPPDGGWGWIIVVATGLSNFCILPILQSFGLIFRDRFEQLGISSSETTTILNINCAVTSCIGLINGPLFKKYNYRQVSFVGALLCAVSITVLSLTETFAGAVIFFSISFGAGVGIVMSANALALNTYFKDKRRIATGFSWTCTGMGPIVMPQIITLLMPTFGMQGTVLLFGGFAFNALPCALLLQPVSWHAKKEKNRTKSLDESRAYRELPGDKKAVENGNSGLPTDFQSRSLENVVAKKGFQGTLSRATSKFGSQYLYYDDEEDGATGIDVIGPGTPMMSRANDGWFSKRNLSNVSLASRSSKKQLANLSRQPSLMALSRGPSTRTLNRQISDVESHRRKPSNLQQATTPLLMLSESCEHGEDNCKDPRCLRKLEYEREFQISRKSENRSPTDGKNSGQEETLLKRFLKATIVFFDLDLLRDLVYVNLMLGITFANFAELNFSLLTPFILGEYGYEKSSVATVMSVLGGVDVVTRIAIPFIASCIGWDNRSFFLVGVGLIAIGRIVLAHVQDFSVTMLVAILIGVGKAFRTIFMALVIPSHVPLSRLPGASGLQLLTSGVVSLVLGPFVGWLRDTAGDYAILLHCLNIFTYLTILSWTLEVFVTGRQEKKRREREKTAGKEFVGKV